LRRDETDERFVGYNKNRRTVTGDRAFAYLLYSLTAVFHITTIKLFLIGQSYPKYFYICHSTNH